MYNQRNRNNARALNKHLPEQERCFFPVVGGPCVPTHSPSSSRLVLSPLLLSPPFSSLFGGSGHFPEETFFLLLKVVGGAKSPSHRHEVGEGSCCQLCRSMAVSQGQHSKSSMIWLLWKLRIRCQHPFQLCNTPVMATANHRSWGTLRSRLPFANLGKFLTHLHQIWNDLYTICSCFTTLEKITL